MKAVLLIDDIDHANGKRTEADGTHVLALDGQAVELDLTDAHYTELTSQLAHWFKVGHASGLVARTGSRTHDPARRSYLKGLRDWYDSQGRSDAYRTESGKYYYSKGLRAEYDASLAG
jgi:hypothetical protein